MFIILIVFCIAFCIQANRPNVIVVQRDESDWERQHKWETRGDV